ncbi:MAG: peptidoglycan-binding protein [Microcoleaceae cyanobacterium]
MMRVPTITTILSLVALFNLTPTRAIANNETESFTSKPEGDFIDKPHSDTSKFAQEDTSKSKVLEKKNTNNFQIPFLPGSSRFFGKSSQPELFSKPFYSGVPKKENDGKNLSQGSRGAEVWAVQRRLQARGFDPGSVDSVFGSRTTQAVKAFQDSKGLNITGIVDETTWKALAQPSFTPRPQIRAQKPQIEVQKPQIRAQKPQIEAQKLLAKGDRGSKVKTLQVRLETIGFDPGPIDGIFGIKTIRAVKEFQQAKGIKPDGVVDKKTWETLSRK